MKLMKKNLFSTLILILVIATSAVIYLLLPYNKEYFDRLVMGCIIFSELLSFINILVYNAVSDKKKLPLATGGYTASAIYVSIFAIVSILFSVYYRHAEKTYLILFAILTTAFLIASILIYLIGKAIASNAAKVEKSSAAFKKLEYKIGLICSNNNNQAYRATFEKLLETIKSCDQSNYVDTDDEVNKCLEQLMTQLDTGERNDEKVGSICERIFCLIKQRTAEVNQLKLGGI